jgi:protein-tyrosine phosphatase
LDFARKAFADVEAKILFSCSYGASRSPALALAILADYLGAGSEKEALRQIVEIRHCAVPNSFVVKLGDVLLQRDGVPARKRECPNLNLHRRVYNLLRFLRAYSLPAAEGSVMHQITTLTCWLLNR